MCSTDCWSEEYPAAVLALATGGIIMTAGAAIYYFMVGAPITEADLETNSSAAATQNIKLASR